jgi:hypothetical protein
LPEAEGDREVERDKQRSTEELGILKLLHMLHNNATMDI